MEPVVGDTVAGLQSSSQTPNLAHRTHHCLFILNGISSKEVAPVRSSLHRRRVGSTDDHIDTIHILRCTPDKVYLSYYGEISWR